MSIGRLSALQTAPAFVRISVARGDETVLVDLVAEPVAVVEPPVSVDLGGAMIQVDTAHEILVNKLCALLERSELRDLVDVDALLQAGGDLRAASASRPGQGRRVFRSDSCMGPAEPRRRSDDDVCGDGARRGRADRDDPLAAVEATRRAQRTRDDLIARAQRPEASVAGPSATTRGSPSPESLTPALEAARRYHLLLTGPPRAQPARLLKASDLI